MGKFIKDAWAEGVESAKPRQWAGQLIELDLAPESGFQKERKKAAGGASAKVVWVKFARNSAGTKVFVLDRNSSAHLGEVFLDSASKVESALHSGVNVGTCFITEDGGVWNARLRLGDHRFNPKPFWK